MDVNCHLILFFYLATKSESLITTKNNIPLMIFHKTKETEVNDGR